MTVLVVIAKECLPGRAKTRLHPPLSLEQAAELAAACLDDTLRAVGGLPATRRVLAFDGVIPPAAAAGWEILPQVSGGLDERLGAIFDTFTEPTVLVGMDTPQITADLLAPVFAGWVGIDAPGTDSPGTDSPDTDSPDQTDAWLGLAEDGGFWALALAHPTGSLIRGVAMSQDDTGAVQLARLTDAGLRVRSLPPLMDVDTIDDAHRVAAEAPHGLFAATLAAHLAAPPTPTPAAGKGPRS